MGGSVVVAVGYMEHVSHVLRILIGLFQLTGLQVKKKEVLLYKVKKGQIRVQGSQEGDIC